MMRVLILGSGAKDHAVAWWFSRSCYISALYIAPGNLATARFAINLPSVNPSDPADVYEACTVYNIDFVFIGTEAPLFTGVVQYLTDRGIRTFGAPTRLLKLEGDRSFSRAFMARHNIPVPRGSFFKDRESLRKYLEKHDGETFIIKSNSVTPSRIMLTSDSAKSLIDFADSLLQRSPVLLEEHLQGIPASCTLLLDNNGYLMLPLTSDYTQKAADDKTPTGGMGAICPVPIIEALKDEIRERIIEPTLYGMKVEQLSYKGVLTLSLIITDDRKPYLVDYHVRFNDPAAQAMIPLIQTDIIEILNAMQEDKISSVDLSVSELCSVAVVLASEGYPMKPEIGREVKGLTNMLLEPIAGYPLVFCGALQDEGGRAITTGGRNITVVGFGENLERANHQAYKVIKHKDFGRLWYRDDIGNAYFIS